MSSSTWTLTLDPEGKLLTSAIYGKIEVNCRLSGMPDISLSLSNSHLIEDYSFHPSVRLAGLRRSGGVICPS